MEKEIGNIHIVLTTFCNMGCPGCYQEHLKETNNFYLNDEQIANIRYLYKKFKSENKDIKVSFFGGEPLLKADTLIDILWFLKEEEMDIKYINIPTSGGPQLKLLKQHLPRIKRVTTLTFPKAKTTVSLSYDGPDNIKRRNIPSNLIEEGFSILINNNVEPEYTSCVIPIGGDELPHNYFISTYLDVVRRTGLAPTFTIPHIMTKKLDYIALNIELEKLLEHLDIRLVYKQGYHTNGVVIITRPELHNRIPKLIMDTIDRILKPELNQDKYNWCQAGRNHFALTGIPGKMMSDCEFLDIPAQEAKATLDNWCRGCSVAPWCQRPCLKNAENLQKLSNMGDSEDITLLDYPNQLNNQCNFRKVLIHTIKTKLDDQIQKLISQSPTGKLENWTNKN